MLLEITANSNKGYTPRRNEDIILLGKELFRDTDTQKSIELSENDRFVIAVADGIGGHKAGDIASKIVCKKLADFFYNIPDGLDIRVLKSFLEEWVVEIHSFIKELGNENSALQGMGTTLVALIFYEDKVLWINCGDSRIYRLRNNILAQLSRDHSLAADTGDPDIPTNIITNSIGAGYSVYFDIDDITEKIYNKDAFLLCSDGLSDTLSDDEIELKLVQNSLNELVNYAIKKGARDNVSACFAKINN